MLQLILAVFLMLTSSLHLLRAVAQGEPAVMKHYKFVNSVTCMLFNYFYYYFTEYIRIISSL